MADIVSAVINKAVDIGANMILEESHRLYWLREDVGWLEREMKHMQAYLENAEVKKLTNPNVVSLIKDIRELVHDVEDILDIYCYQVELDKSNDLLKRMPTCFLPYGWNSSMFSREIEKIRKRVEGIDSDRTRYGVVNDISSTDDVLHVDDSIIIGFEQDIKELKSKLEEYPFVSIVGMAGLGKTTLAKKVFKDIKDGFDFCVSVSVSQEPNITSLVRDIASQVGLQKNKQEENLEANLYSFLQGKRYVVFLDDIWNTEAWDNLKGCFPSVSVSASRIIITSRNSGVGRYIGGEKSLHELHLFDDSKSWELFTKLIMPANTEFDSVLEMIGRQIVQKCGGVPLAIVVIVGMLRERGMSEFSWNGVLHSIGENASDECSQILGLSYSDLPIFLKPCFLYFGNFPEDYEFSASKVIRLWMAEKFFLRVGRDWEPEDVGADYISKLEARNLIQVVRRGCDGRVKKFRIHDLLHSLCVNVGREIDFLNTDGHLESSSPKRVRRLSIPCRGIAENKKLIFQMTRLRALFHFELDKEVEIKCLGSMLGRFKLLQVLKISVYLHVVNIPFQIRSLSHLNYLEIYSEAQVQIPLSIRVLKNLRTLDLRGCQDETLSAIDCSDLKSSWSLKFTNLRKLGLNFSTPENVEVLCGPEPISKKLESLRCWGSSDVRITKSVSLAKYERLMKLEIWWVEMQQLPELPPSLIQLTLEWINLIEDPMKILKNLPKLEILHLNERSYIGRKMDCSGADGFPQLEILELRYLPYLEELIEQEEMGMPKLRQLIIEYCSRLWRIPERLQQLQMEN
ncbi:Apoptotic ATPase [Handroanthus impetiginosus]|uniref:Apoptotic ATPase n=1 Tax=Handroanthus impetiginosus TaxID=429701 RepID=A0A2G9GSP3_9LAMI|nr:Apoptotic ATPase [Handroanthus impetiginosus]